LARYYWPGNVRELENLIKRTLVTTDSNKITKFDFNPVVSSSDEEQYPFIEHSTIREYLKEITQTAEVRFLKQKLKEFKGDITEMAREIDLDRKTIYRKIEEYHIDLDEYRNLNSSKPEKSQ
jgi:DNA-binding NtrC family response regulator